MWQCGSAGMASVVSHVGVCVAEDLLEIMGHLSPTPRVIPSCHNGSTWAWVSNIISTNLHLSMQDNQDWERKGLDLHAQYFSDIVLMFIMDQSVGMFSTLVGM